MPLKAVKRPKSAKSSAIASSPRFQAQPYRLEFEIPGLPRMANSQGRSTHWRVKAKESRAWRQVTALIASAYRPRSPLPVAKLTFTRGSSVEPDSDGLVTGFKPIRDGLKDAGVILDDKMRNVGFPIHLWELAPRGAGFVRVLVEAPPQSEQSGSLSGLKSPT